MGKTCSLFSSHRSEYQIMSLIQSKGTCFFFFFNINVQRIVKNTEEYVEMAQGSIGIS